ncbi:hypothetical protein H1R20_g6737, partial [Candolleomyces eurysporus]
MKRYPGDLGVVQELIKQAERRVETLDTHIQDQMSAGNMDAVHALAEKKKIVSANAAGLKRCQGQLLKAQSDSMDVDATPNSVDLTAQSATPTPNVTITSPAVPVVEPAPAVNIPQVMAPASLPSNSTSAPTPVASVSVVPTTVLSEANVSVPPDTSLPATPLASIPISQLTLNNGAPQAVAQAVTPSPSIPASAPAPSINGPQAVVQAVAPPASTVASAPARTNTAPQAVVQVVAPSASILADAPTPDVRTTQAIAHTSIPVSVDPVVDLTTVQVASRAASDAPSQYRTGHDLANEGGLISMSDNKSDESEWFEEMDIESSKSNSEDSDSDIVELQPSIGKSHFPSYWKNLSLPQQGKLLSTYIPPIISFRTNVLNQTVALRLSKPSEIRMSLSLTEFALGPVDIWTICQSNGRTVCQYHTVYKHGKKTTHNGNPNDKSDLSVTGVPYPPSFIPLAQYSILLPPPRVPGRHEQPKNPNFTLKNILKFFPMTHGRCILHCGCLYEHVLMDFWLWKGFALTSLSHPSRMEGFGMPLKPCKRFLFCLGLKSFCVTLESLYEYDHNDNQVSHVKFRERHVMKLVADIKKTRREEAERAEKLCQQKLKKEKRKMVYTELAENVSEFDANEFFDD